MTWQFHVWMAVLLFAVMPGSAVAQTRQAESQQTDAAATQPAQPGESSATQAAPVADTGQPQGLVHIVPFGKVAGALKNGAAPAGAHLTYWGGQVISNIHVVVVFWGPNVNTAITGGIGQFFHDITTSRHFDLLTEYSTTGVIGSGTPPGASSNQSIGHGFFDSAVTITPSVCPGPAACTVDDTAISVELANQISAGHLPQPVTDLQGNVNSFYMIYFPPGVTITLGGSKSCVVGGFCAYHSNTLSTQSPKFVPYGVEPDFAPPSGCSNGCGHNAILLDNVTEVTSHEMSEAVTDALVGSASVFAPPLAWYDHNSPAGVDLGEIGDICGGQGVSVPAGNTNYVVQTEFSNLQNDCVSAPPVFSMPSPPGGAGPSVPFNLTLTIQSSVTAATLSGYTGTVHFTSSDAGATLPADYTFVAGDAGAHTFSLTLANLGNQTVTATDARSSGFNGTTTINVNTTPDMGITKHHVGNFGVGQTGANYTITASNVGGGPSSGTVSVVDSLPAGLAATAISGTGWSCTLATLTCTRSDALAAGASYPPIVLTVNVTAAGPTTVTNTATVSGGGEVDTGNNLVGDSTTITNPGVDLGVSISPNQVFTTQGATGLTYSNSITNFGSVSTSGTVSVATTLPAGLTATAISGTGWSCTLASLTCTRNDALASAGSYPAITVTFNVALNAPLTASSISSTVTATGDINAANDTVNASVNISPVVAISSNTGSVTVNAGQPAQFLIGVTAGQAAGLITFSCGGLPTASSCSFNPASLNSTSGIVTMTIATTARGAVVTGPRQDNRTPLLWLALLSLAAIAGLSMKARAKPRRVRRLVPILGTGALLIAGILAGCGGSKPPPPPPIVGTPAGTYAITVTATSPNGTASRTMSLVVK